MVGIFGQLLKLSVTLQILVSDCLSFCAAGLRSRTALAAENLFLRKQLALFQEREKKAAATGAADRFVLSKLARFFDWRSALVIVKPATLIGCIELRSAASGVGNRDPSAGQRYRQRCGAYFIEWQRKI